MEKLNYNQLYYFNTVALEGSLARAGIKLGVSSSNLSEQMKNLERSFNFEIFNREGGQVSLTAKGQQVYEFTRKMFAVGAHLQRFLTPDTSQKAVLTIGITSSISRAFASDYLKDLINDPKVLFRSQIGTHEHLLKELHQLQLDILITDTNPEDPKKEEIQSAVVATSPWLVVCSNSRPELAEHYERRERPLPFIMHPPASTYRWISDRYFEDVGIVPEVVAEMDDTQLIIKAVAEGIGFAFLPQIMVQGDLESKRLFKVATLDDYSAKIYVVHLSQKIHEHVARAVELLKVPRTISV